MSVTCICRYVLWKKWFFFNVFINHIPKIHRNVLHKIIDLLYFWDNYDINLWEKIPAEVRLIHAEQMALYNFLILKKERDFNTGIFLWKLWNFQEQWWLLLKTSNTLLHNKKLCSAIFNTVLLIYCIYC